MPYLSKLVKRLTLGWTIAALAACGVPDATTEPETALASGDSVATVEVLPDSIGAIVGSRVRLTAETRDAAGRLLRRQRIRWTSSDSAIASVDTTGEVTLLAAGTAEVSATSGRGRGRTKVTVAPAPVASVVVSPATATVAQGTSVALSATTYSSTGEVLTGRTITWASVTPAVATVSASGVVSGVTAGSAQILATAEGISGSATITVSAPATTSPDPVAPGTVSDLTVTAATDSSVTVRFTEVSNGDAGAASYELRYSVSTFDWASAIGVARGSCSAPIAGTTIGAVRSCEVRGLTAQTTYRLAVRAFRGTLGSSAVYGAVSNVATATTASAAVGSVTLTPGSSALVTGQQATFTATVRDLAGNVITGRTVTWSTSSTAIATVTSGGVVSALSAGTATIRATSGGVTGSATVSVSSAPPTPLDTAGYVPLYDRPFSALNEQGWAFRDYSVSSNNVQGSRIAITPDGNAPRSGADVLQITYPAGYTGGGEPAKTGREFPSTEYSSSMYMSLWVKFSPNWDGHMSSVNKLVYWQMTTDPNYRARLFLLGRGTNAQNLRADLVTQGTPIGDQRLLPPNLVPDAQFVRGRWHKVEVLVRLNTAENFDGQVHMWLDGVKITQYTDVIFVRAAELHAFTGFEVTPVWGGIGDQVGSEAQYLWFDHLFISRGR